MVPRNDLTGERFGRLTVQRFSHARRTNSIWECRCDCGATRLVLGFELKNGKVSGCHRSRRPLPSKRLAGQSSHPLYPLWRGIHQRCADAFHKDFPLYGGRGIQVCERWNDLAAFVADMGPRPDGASIDRIDNDGHYEPSNCRWADRWTQARNTRGNKRLTISGETLCVAEWSERSGIPRWTIRDRLKAGWQPSDAVFTPIRKEAA